MQILAHRGIWNQSDEKNSLKALAASFEIGMGIETDIRDCDGLLVVSHDPPSLSKILLLDELLQVYSKYSSKPLLALNIKSDGLHAPLKVALQKYDIENYFVFDMSVPDTLGYQKLEMPFAARISEYETKNILAQSAEWIWLDAFHDEWFTNEVIEFWLNQGKRVALVSPELHHRHHLTLWEQLKSLSSQTQLYLCTDLVIEAKEFFNAD